MADIQIKDLTAVTTLADGDVIATDIAAGDLSRKITKANLKTTLGIDTIEAEQIVQNDSLTTLATVLSGQVTSIDAIEAEQITQNADIATNTASVSGTSNQLAKFTSASTVGDSLIKDDGDGVNNSGPLSTDDTNTAFGYQAGMRMTGAGTECTNIGTNAGDFATTSIASVNIGSAAGGGNNGNYNVNIGKQVNTQPSNDYVVAIGYRAMRFATALASQSVAIGRNVLLNNDAPYNIAIGDSALFANTTGQDNIAIGRSVASGNFSDCIILGRSATATADNQFVIGNVGTVTSLDGDGFTWEVRINGVDRLLGQVVPHQDTTAATSVISLTNTMCNYYTGTSGAAKSLTTYTTTGTTLGAYAQILINTTSEPTVTGGTKISGATWVTGTDMYMIVSYNGTRVEFFFLEI